jgi:hypothetical protein
MVIVSLGCFRFIPIYGPVAAPVMLAVAFATLIVIQGFSTMQKYKVLPAR